MTTTDKYMSIGPLGINLLIAECRKLPTIKSGLFDGEEADGTPKYWRNRPFVSLTHLERLLTEFFTPAKD